MKRVVADTNVLVSALQFGGKPKYLLELAVDGQLDLALAEALLEETLRVLSDKFRRTAEDLRETDKQQGRLPHRHSDGEHQGSRCRPVG